MKPAEIDFSFSEAWGDEPAAAEELERLEQEVASVEAMIDRLYAAGQPLPHTAAEREVRDKGRRHPHCPNTIPSPTVTTRH